MEKETGINQNAISRRLLTLQDRKNEIEQEISSKNEVLRNLCIQEAGLTGILPLELQFINNDVNNSTINTNYSKKKMGISYQYPGQLLSKLNDKDESFSQLEVEIQVQSGIAEAAYSLSKDDTLSKGVRRKNFLIYEKCQQKLVELYHSLNLLLASKNFTLQNLSSSVPSLTDVDSTISSLKQNERLQTIHAKIGTLNVSNSFENKKFDKIKNGKTSPRLINRNVSGCVDQQYNLPTYIQMQSSHITSLNNYQSNSEVIHYNNNDSKITNILKYPSPSTSPSPSTIVTSISPAKSPKNGQFRCFWKQNDTGELIWCSVNNNRNKPPFMAKSAQSPKLSSIDPKIVTILNNDHKFGSLDRRKHKKMHHYHRNDENQNFISVSNCNDRIDFVSSVPTNEDSSNGINLRKTTQLIRTQSLGNVGLKLTEDNLSEDTQKIHKEKEWCETSLDSPNDDCHLERNLKSNNARLLYCDNNNKNEVKISPTVKTQLQPQQQPQQQQQQRIADLSVEMPMNCMVVEAGKWLPYRESTKPFEMSDFYKYSTKFRSKQNHINLQTTNL